MRFKQAVLALVSLVALVFGGLVPAHADPPGLPTSFYLIQLKALPNETAFAVGRIDAGYTTDLVGYHIAADGTVGPQIVFEAGAPRATGALRTSDVTVLRDGSVVFGWAIDDALHYQSTISASFSSDGNVWQTPVNPAPMITSNQTTPSCSTTAHCAYLAPRFAQDGKGKIAIAYSTANNPTDLKLKFTTNKTTWSSAIHKQVASMGTANYNFLIGLISGGFQLGGNLCYGASCGYWMATVNTVVTKFSQLKTWYAKDYRSFSTFGTPTVVSSTLAIVPISGTFQSNPSLQLSWITFNPATGAIGAIKSAMVAGGSNSFAAPATLLDSEGRLTLAFKSVALDSNNSTTNQDNYFKVVFEPGSTTPTITLIGSRLNEIYQYNQLIIAEIKNIYLDTDHQLHLVVERGNTHDAYDYVYTQTGLANPVTVASLTNQTYNAVSTGNGNQISVVTPSSGSNYPTPTTVSVILQNAKPKLLSNPVVTGTAKTSKSLSVVAPTFVADGGIPTLTYVWYACSSAQTSLAFTTAVTGCTQVSTGSSQTYLLKKTDKAKFMSVAITAQIGQQSSTVFSKTTAKVG